ncbi:MAG TPA: putative glycolipid-binding domain-containing protein [Gemmatimonadaceae bacterium]|nr:putative glycolipid-binding domain-containing protein [Gemmatimonadaceae bacterium]
MRVCTILWRRLDAPGIDACRLDESDDGWALHGSAACSIDDAPTRLDYRVTCDHQWRTREGIVCGWVGTQLISLTITRASDGRWRLGDSVIAELDGCADLDFGFSPATNLLQLRRIALVIGESADVPVAWLDVRSGTLSRLEQRYHRVSETEYAYEAPRFDYRATLEVNACGFALRYPGLWVVIS